MLKKRIFPVLLVIMSLSFTMCAKEEQPTGQNNAPEVLAPLRVTAAADVPGYFEINGDTYGYSYELLATYAEKHDRKFEFTARGNLTRMAENLGNNNTDICVSLSNKTIQDGLSIKLYTTDYVVLAKKSNRKFISGKQLSDMIGDGTVMISSGFESTKSYNLVLDSLTKAKIYISPKDGYTLAEELSGNEFDFLICERSEALIAQEFLRNVKCIYEFDEMIDVTLTFSSANSELCNDFIEWFDEYKTTSQFTELHGAYLENGFKHRSRAIHKHNSTSGSISSWDSIIKQVGEREGIDWRLLSAIAYKESRFYNNLTSRSGAKGLMQIMPVTARHFKVDVSKITDPEVNITLAAKLLKSIESSLKFQSWVTAYDKLSITLAGYNCGVGTVSDARKLAVAEGKNPDSWDVISGYLRLMGDTEFESDTVNYRRFNGHGQTINFVEGVQKRYAMYSRTVNK